MSLCIWSDAEEASKSGAGYEIGKAWFEEVRAKGSPDLLETIEQFSFHNHEMWEHLLSLAYTCPAPRDIASLQAYIESLDPLELRLYQLGYYVREHRRATPPDVIYAAAQGDAEAKKTLLRTSFPDDASWQKTLRWILSLDTIASKERLLDIVQGWYHDVFREQEPQVMPILARDVDAKRAMQPSLSAEELIAACTGWEYVPEPGVHRIVLVPSYVLRPYNSYTDSANTRIFFYPVADESINADASAPPVRLLRLAKALADERRMRILRKLSGGSYTLQEIADDLGAAKTTIHHHLILLRSAGLVRMRMSDKRYSLRQDAFDHLEDLLKGYLKQPPG